VTRRVTRDADSLEGDPCQLERLVPRKEDVGDVRARDHAVAGSDDLVQPLEPLALVGRHVHRSPGRLGQLRDAAEMVEVTVRDEDAGAAASFEGAGDTLQLARPARI